MNNPPVFPLFYLGPVSYYATLLQHKNVVFERHENFPKQTWRNRCEICGPNGRLKLIVPVLKTGERRTMASVEISHAENWQKLHWKSLESAYRSSAYFEFYESDFAPFYQNNHASLFQFNLELHLLICRLLGLDIGYQVTEKYAEITLEKDFRGLFDAKRKSQNHQRSKGTYIQVFSDRMPFQVNLSIVDLIFNEGPNSLQYLKETSKNHDLCVTHKI